MSLSVLPIQAADKLLIDNRVQIIFQSTQLQDQTSLTLWWLSISQSGCYCVVVYFAYEGCLVLQRVQIPGSVPVGVPPETGRWQRVLP